MYTLLVNHDNTIITTIKERIVKRSKLVDNIHILVPVDYKGMDMTDFEVTMFYQLPVSSERYSINLTKQDELYKEKFLEYFIPADTWITKEAGNVGFYLTLSKVEMSDNSEIVQYVRKVTGGIIEIASCDDWGSGIADSLLQSLDQRIIQLQMVAKQIDEANQDLYDTKADGLSYEDNVLSLLSGSKKIGHEVTISSDCDCENNGDGTIKVINF